MNKKKFIMVCEDTRTNFEDKVSSLLEQGYELHGETFKSNSTYYQALILKENNKK